MKFFRDILTDNSGDFDIVSIMAVLSFFVFLGLAIYSVAWKGSVFDMQSFGIAIAAMVSTLGGAYHWKCNKEPK